MNRLVSVGYKLLAAATLSLIIAPNVLSEGAAPSPGDNNQSAPVPGQAVHTTTVSGGYRQLPLSAGDAQTRLEELKVLLAQSRPQGIQDAVFQLCEWLNDMTDAHNKLASIFAKNDATKAQAESEKQAAIKFNRLKNQAQLLKADVLIKQCRFPEALGPLVDIIVAEPRSATGQEAYKRLQEIGFAEEAEPKTESKANDKNEAASKEVKSIAPISQISKPATPAATIVAKSLSKEKKAISSSSVHTPGWISGTPYGAGSKYRKHVSSGQ